MYRSHSTSSVYFDTLLHSDGRSWTAVDPSEHRNSAPNGTSAGLSLTMPRSKEAPVTQNTLTSALTGSKMATNAGIPTGTGKRPLPKALLPKSARTPTTPAPATPSMMYGSSLGLNSPNVLRRDNFSGSLTPSVAKSLSLTPEQRLGVQRMESTPVGAALLSPAVHTTDNHVTESARWNSLGPRPHTAGAYPPGNSGQRTFGASVDASGRDSRPAGRSHPLASWTPMNVTPVRRREPVVQDSIVPILKAALGKDNDPQDKRMQKEEETVNRQVFGRTARAGSGTLRTVSMFGSTDDVFGRSNSYLQLSPYGDSTIPRVHLKSHSEVIPPRGFEDLQRKALRNSMSSAVSTSDIYGTKTSGDPGVHEIAQKEFRSYDEAQASGISLDRPSTLSEHPLPSSRQVASYGMRLGPADPSSWNSPRSTSNFVHSNGTRPSPARTPSWEPTPPLSAPPIPFHAMNYPSTGRPSMDMDSQRGSWYEPIPDTPRKVIMTPSVVLDSPRNLADTKRSSRSLMFFGESFSPASYPLLAKVETEAVNGEVGDPIVTKVNSKNAEIKLTVNLTSTSGWNEPASETSRKINAHGFSKDSPAEIVSVQTSGIENFTLPSPPIGFRDDALMFSSSVANATTTTAATAVNMPPLPINHQATDSMNTEDSGLERWEKDGNEHSGDEQDTSSGHTTSAETGYRSSALKKRSWREDTSEGRGSLSSSPRPHNSDEHGASPTDDPYLTLANSGRLVDDKTVPSNSILRQLLAENARQTTRNFDETTTLRGSHLDHSESIDSEPPPLPPSVPPPFDCESDANGSAGGIDTESCHSYSTAVQSTVTVIGGTAEIGDRSRSTEDAQREYGGNTLRGSAAEDARKDDGALREKRTVVGDACLDLSEALIRLPGFRETQELAPQRIAVEASRYGSERLHSDTGRKGRAEEKVEEGERMVFEIVKGPVGVGFCIEGGKGALSGDRPIAVKRVFKGGSMDGTANLRPGDELLSIGAQSLVGLSHYEAWKRIKGLPNGTFPLVIRRTRVMSQQQQQQLL